ncbi:MAG: InlB B-repeat-containing protein, partial [Clostridia bacterium]|nr:InlB B-repeat-containing protein [Clostridia bacterium]
FAGPSKGAGGDYEIIESTYSGTKEQTFTISIYASYLEDLTIDCSPPAYNGTTTTVVGCTATAKLIASNSAPSYSYLRGVIDPIVSDVKDENTGEVIATTSVGSGGVVTITATAAGTGYLYLYAYEGATPKSVEIIVSAGYTVTFDSCGGSAVASQTVTYGSNATEPETPTRSGYTFEGWYVSDIADEAYSFSVAVPKDLTLYARWTANTTSTSTTTKDSDSETSSEPIETTTKSEETTTASTEPDETTAEPDEETTAPDEETTAQDYDSETTAEPTEPDEETTGEAAETTSTEDMTETTETQTENTSEKSDTDSAAVANNGNGGDDGDTGSDEENGSNTWIVVLVAVLLVAAAGATAFIVLRRNKSVENVNLAESTETENDNDNEEGEIDGNTGGDDE